MLTGKYYPTLARLAPSDGQDTVPLFLRRYGWKTAAFYPPAVFFVQGDKLKAYQDSNFQFEYVKVELSGRPRADVRRSPKFFASREARRGRSCGCTSSSRTSPTRNGRTTTSAAATSIATTARSPTPTRPSAGCWRYLDKHRPGTIVILTADHGEEFDEHGGRYHGTTLYDEQIRVPLIIAVPGVPAHVVQGPVELVDLAPTVLGAAGHPGPGAHARHRPGPLAGQPPAPPTTGCGFAFAEVDEQRMVASARDKLICRRGQGASAPTTTCVADPRRAAATWPRPAPSGWRRCAPSWTPGWPRTPRSRRGARAAARPSGDEPAPAPSSGRGWATPGRRPSWRRCWPTSARRWCSAGRRPACWPPRCPRCRRPPALRQAARDPPGGRGGPTRRGWAAVGQRRAWATLATGAAARPGGLGGRPPVLAVQAALVQAALPAAGAGRRAADAAARAGADRRPGATAPTSPCAGGSIAALGRAGRSPGHRGRLLAHLRPGDDPARGGGRAGRARRSRRAAAPWPSAWRSDEYVPVRAEAARALGRIGGARRRGPR